MQTDVTTITTDWSTDARWSLVSPDPYQLLIGGRLVLANSVGDVVAVSPENGQTVASADVDQPVFIPPITANDQIYIVTDEARLVVLR